MQTRQFGFTWSGPRASRPNHGLGSSPQACCPNGGRKTVAANLQLTTWPCRKLRTAEDRKRGKFFLYYAILHQLWPFFIFFLKKWGILTTGSFSTTLMTFDYLMTKYMTTQLPCISSWLILRGKASDMYQFKCQRFSHTMTKWQHQVTFRGTKLCRQLLTPS